MNRKPSGTGARLFFSLLAGATSLAIGGAPALAGELAEAAVGRTEIQWKVKGDLEKTVLIVSGPDLDIRREFAGDRTPSLRIEEGRRGRLPDGDYAWELRAVPKVSPETRERLAKAREASDRGERVDPRELGIPRGPHVEFGYFAVRGGAFVSDRETEPAPERREAEAPLRVPADLEVGGSLRVRGTKQFVAADPADPSKVLAYAALEGPEAGTYFRGSARTVDGVAVIELPPHFAATTESDGLTVQLTPQGGWSRLFVAEKTTHRLVVRDLEGADGVAFDFLIQGIRKGYAGYRVERAGDAD